MNKKANRALSILLALVMVFGMLPAMSQTAQAAGTNKAIQLVDHSGTTSVAANIEGGQASAVWFGTYLQSPDGSGWFNDDPIKWPVLSNADGKLFLLSDQNLDVMRYHNDNESVTWEKSTMRSWLNGYGASENTGGASGTDYSSDNFIKDAFVAAELAAIASTNVVNDKNPVHNTPGGNNTTDKVFLLSIDEAGNSGYGFTDDNSRISTNTAYVEKGGKIHFDEGIDNTMYGVGESDVWWLRSPGGDDKHAADVHTGGFVQTYGYDVDDYLVAVRPALNLNLSSVLFTSAAADGKAGTTGTLSEITEYTGSDWKLTLKDESRKFAVTETAATGAPGETVTLNYTGATVYNTTTARNEYISAILTDENGNLLRYGRLTQPSAKDGTVDVKIPADLTEGTYTLKVFSEQYNGALFTDYASAFDDVTLTVGKAAGISVNSSDITLPYGDQSTIVVTTDPAGLDVEFIPNGDGFVSVDENGVVTALKLGVTTITVKLIPPYIGETTVMVTVVPRLITEADFTALPTETKTYDGTEQTQAITSSTLKEGTDYEVVYTNNINAGTASYTVKGKGNYTGTITKQFTINKADPSVSGVTVTAPAAIYADTPIGDIQLGFTSDPTGGSIKLDDGQTLTVGTKDYNWTYTPADTANYNTATGKVSITVEAFSVTGITLNSDSAKKVYTEGDPLDVAGLTLEVSKSDGSKEAVNVTEAMVSGFDSSKIGKQTLTVSYEGFTATYEVEVKAKTNPPVTTSTISYNLNGGTLNGKTGTVTIQAENGTTITLPAPTREGYTFDYWEGSRYNAGDSYTVNGDHTFTAQWKKNSTTPGTSDPGKTSPKTGDESNLALHGSLMFLSVAAMIVLLLYARKRKIEK